MSRAAAARLAPVARGALRDVHEVLRPVQRPGDLLLHGHEARPLPGILDVGAVVVGVPEACPPSDVPCPALEGPGEGRGPPPGEHGLAGGRVHCARGDQHPVADGADGLTRPERIDRHPLHLFALEVVAHTPGPVTSRQHEGVVVGPARLGPVEGRAERGILDQVRIGRPGPAVRPQDAPDHGDAAQDRHHAPGIESLSGDHEVVCLARVPRGRGEDHFVPGTREHLPRDGDLGRVEVAGGDGNQHDRHGWPATLPIQASRQPPPLNGFSRRRSVSGGCSCLHADDQEGYCFAGAQGRYPLRNNRDG